MPTITINTDPEEREAVLDVIKKLQGETVPVSKIAQLAGLTHGRARYAIDDLIVEGAITRIATRQFNKHYVRYSYQVNYVPPAST